MIDKELEMYKDELRAKGVSHYANTGSPEDIKRSQELSCADMINSILAYHWYFGLTGEDIMRYEENSYYNYLEDYVKTIGRDRVIELINDQINDIKEILHNVYTDSEGLTYNSIVWKR